MTHGDENRPVLYLVATGAPLTRHAHKGAAMARENGWRVAVIATDAAEQWLNREQLDALDIPVLNRHRPPDNAKRLPRPDAVLLAPGTFNTINKFATGAADNYALSVLCEALGARRPIVAVPFASESLAGHPAWLASLAVLRYAGVNMIDAQTGTPNVTDPLESGTGDAVADAFQWQWVFEYLSQLARISEPR